MPPNREDRLHRPRLARHHSQGPEDPLATKKVAVKAGRGAKVKIDAAQGLRNAALRPLAGLAIKVGVVYQTKNSAGKKIVTTKTIYLHVPRS